MSDFLVATGTDFVRLHSHGAHYTTQRGLEGSRAHSIARSETAIWVATLGEGVWCSHDGGTRWSNFSPPLPASCVWSFALGASELHESPPTNSAPDRALYAGGDDGTLVKSRDGGKSWDWLDNLWLLPSSNAWKSPRVQHIAPHPQHPDWLLVSLRGAGVLFSSDGGFSWDDARENAGKNVRQLCWHDTSPERAVALSPDGISFSIDGGWTWQRSHFDFQSSILLDMAFDSAINSWLLLSHGKNGSQLWQGDEHNWHPIRLSPPNNATLRGVAARADEWVLGWSNGQLHSSDSRGRIWNKVALDADAPDTISDIWLLETSS